MRITEYYNCMKQIYPGKSMEEILEETINILDEKEKLNTKINELSKRLSVVSSNEYEMSKQLDYMAKRNEELKKELDSICQRKEENL